LDSEFSDSNELLPMVNDEILTETDMANGWSSENYSRRNRISTSDRGRRDKATRRRLGSGRLSQKLDPLKCLLGVKHGR